MTDIGETKQKPGSCVQCCNQCLSVYGLTEVGEVQENMLHRKIVCWPQFRVQLDALVIFRIEYVSGVLPKI